MTPEATITESSWPRGSEWRKWDLHVHSPASFNFQGDWNGFIIQLGNADCDVIGINDYFSVAGYKEVRKRLADSTAAEGNKAYREALEKLKTKALLPVVECRMTNVVIGKKGSGPNINFHLIFDPVLSLDDIERFIKNLKVKDQSIGTRYSEPKFLLEDCQTDFLHAVKALRDDETFRDRVAHLDPIRRIRRNRRHRSADGRVVQGRLGLQPPTSWGRQQQEPGGLLSLER